MLWPARVRVGHGVPQGCGDGLKFKKGPHALCAWGLFYAVTGGRPLAHMSAEAIPGAELAQPSVFAADGIGDTVSLGDAL